MTRRERLERKAERRRQWAESRRSKAESAFTAAFDVLKHIPPGQPILVGHHSERRHRRDLARHDSAMSRAIESEKMANHHETAAAGLEAQLETSIYSDDPDAIEALEARVAELEAERERRKAANAEARKAGTVHPYPPYSLQNLGARIRTAKQRIEHVRRQQAQRSQAEAAGGMVVKMDDRHNWATVTFAERPERSILDALKGAGFRFRGGSWHGYADKLPANLKPPPRLAELVASGEVVIPAE